MYKFLTVSKKYPSFRQCLILSVSLVSTVGWAQALKRAPANYTPNDDIEVKPIDNEVSLYTKYVERDNSNDVVTVRNQLKVWNDNQTFADQYGMDSSGAGQYYVPTSQEKWKYFNDRYLKYVRRQTEQPIKEMPKVWYEEYRVSNEVDTIDEMEKRFKATQGKATTSSGEKLPEALQAKEVSVWKKTRFIFQPRVDQGLVLAGLKNDSIYARAWVGVNGRTEINVEHSIDSIGFRSMVNYYANTKTYFTSFDQKITDNIYARLTSDKSNPGFRTNDAVMLQYAKSF